MAHRQQGPASGNFRRMKKLKREPECQEGKKEKVGTRSGMARIHQEQRNWVHEELTRIEGILKTAGFSVMADPEKVDGEPEFNLIVGKSEEPLFGVKILDEADL